MDKLNNVLQIKYVYPFVVFSTLIDFCEIALPLYPKSPLIQKKCPMEALDKKMDVLPPYIPILKPTPLALSTLPIIINTFFSR